MTPGFRARHDPIGLDADGKGLTLKPYNTVKGGHMKLSVRILIGVVTSVFLFAAIAAPASAASIKIGFVFSMTGGAAVYGTSQKEGASLAIDQINAAAGSSGLQITPIFEDDASVPQQGTNVFNKLINGDKVSIIIGPTLSNTAKITDPIAQKAGVPVLAISNTICRYHRDRRLHLPGLLDRKRGYSPYRQGRKREAGTEEGRHPVRKR